MDVLSLIAEVQQRRALWDTSIPFFIRKVEWNIQWLDVSDALKVDVATCKKRFKRLRERYRCEIRKIQQGSLQVSNWTYFRSLEFMRCIFDPTGLVAFAPEHYEFKFESEESKIIYHDQKLWDDLNFDLDNDDSIDFVIMGDIFKRDSPEQLHLPANHSMLAGPSSSYDGPICNDNCLINSQMTTTNVADSLSVASSPSRSESNDDADYNFLASLKPHVQSLSDTGKLKFRMEASRILMELKKEEATPEPPGMEADTDPNTYFVPNSYMNDYEGNTMDECEVKTENEPLL
ncbi:uncharacterized protein LOC117186223 [Drosophila miranda]|uniref:uncharacterized protein LOC117186223 n=1 Tax=Drosophila miranda TaxID=7229 RepID=UPI00143F7B08|nr:uncharacterized protein LOC117186223 [Drosophila miranda]